MNYVINPRVFYWIQVLSVLQTVFALFGVTFTIAAIGLLIGYIYNKSEYEHGEYQRNKHYMHICKKWLDITGPIGIMLILASIFIPGRTTSIEMLIARTATFDNVNWSVQQIKEIVDYIVNAMKTI